MMYKRPQFKLLRSRLEERRKFIQVLSGPRQCGKTTLAHQVTESLKFPTHTVSADSPVPHDAFGWTLEQYIYFGGYPGSADLIDEPDWRPAVNSLVAGR